MEPIYIGERIRRARESRNLSQEQLAELINRDQRSISEYENGKRRIYAHDLPTIAQALDMPLMYFYEDLLSEDDLDVALIGIFHRLDYDGRKGLLEVIQSLVNLLTRSG